MLIADIMTGVGVGLVVAALLIFLAFDDRAECVKLSEVHGDRTIQCNYTCAGDKRLPGYRKHMIIWSSRTCPVAPLSEDLE